MYTLKTKRCLGFSKILVKHEEFLEHLTNIIQSFQYSNYLSRKSHFKTLSK